MSKKSTIETCAPVDHTKVPYRTLYTGAKMPSVGLGTFGSDHVSNEEIATAVEHAAKIGYRHFDCASVYGNEKEIGNSFSNIIADGIPRKELWITSKLWNDKHNPEDVVESCKQTLNDLQLKYLDLYLIHWPFPNTHEHGCDISSRSTSAKPYIHENYMKTWREMERLVELGLVKHIGTSNMTIQKLELLLRDAEIKPACNEMELHPHFQQPKLFDYLMDNQIQPIGFCPIGSPTRPERDKADTDTVDLEDPVIMKIAERHNVHPAVICVKWAVQRGQIPIPFSAKPSKYISNLACSISDPLTDKEMKEIKSIDRGCRLIKGDVFLWKENQNWEDLWDIDGTITPA